MMMEQNHGASDKSDRAGGPSDLSRSASQPEALIPSAKDRQMEAPARAIAASKRGLKPNDRAIDGIWHTYVGQARAAIMAFIEDAARMEKRADWKVSRPAGLEREIARFKLALPGWWFSVGECQVSADASCGPTRESDDLKLVGRDTRFNDGFHTDLPQPATMAEALRTVRLEARSAIRAAQGTPTRSAETTGSVGEADGGPVTEGHAPLFSPGDNP